MTGGHSHSADFQRLIERRRKFIEGLDANKGEINLEIFEDFYPDRAHFVYELLQNAEDAGATEVAFTLMPDRLVCEHDGRAFALEDVTSITGLHDSTKVNVQDFPVGDRLISRVGDHREGVTGGAVGDDS